MHCSKQTSTSVSIALHLFHIYSKWHNYISKYIIADVRMGLPKLVWETFSLAATMTVYFEMICLFMKWKDCLMLLSGAWCCIVHCKTSWQMWY